MFEETVQYIQQAFNTKDFLPLHEPVFLGNEKKYLNECIDTTFVSSVGKFVDQFESMVASYTGAKYAVAIVNGTAALEIALKLVGVDEQSEVITQSLTFVATCNAITYCGAKPVFVDVDKDTMGLCPTSLASFLKEQTSQKAGGCFNKTTGKRIVAVVPMHTFGHPCRIEEIAVLCKQYNISLVEDAAESFGSYYNGQHTGTFGEVSVFSFNGNKTITTGGGGMIITNDESLAKRAKHITTTAKVPHPYEFVHDEVGYNYRLPNINAAIGCAQMESIEFILNNKRKLAVQYENFFADRSIKFVKEMPGSKVNYWLNAVVLKDKATRDEFLKVTNDAGVMTRPIWQLMTKLEMFKRCQAEDLTNSSWLEERVVNIPSGVRV